MIDISRYTECDSCGKLKSCKRMNHHIIYICKKCQIKEYINDKKDLISSLNKK